MPSTDSRIDAYIKKAAPFAQPILQHLRQLVHKVCPEVVETVKWGFPHFEYKGILCSMAAFKQHCSFGFWKATLMKDDKELLNRVGKTDMGHFDKITTLKDLPSDKILTAYIKEAMRLNEEDIKVVKPKTAAPKVLEAPADLIAALRRNKAAQKTFDAFSPSNKKEYIEWILDAKTDATREKRLETAIEWMAEGKIRHWKYVR
ncbi:MAG TPA: YdeI/OmpD-associated family protein [Chitinophagaceae bacterium]|nr:YdeI/OmpD-associated family protein [Chitinophagaceae bacterium]